LKFFYYYSLSNFQTLNDAATTVNPGPSSNTTTTPSPAKVLNALLSNVTVQKPNARAPILPITHSKKYIKTVLSSLQSIKSKSDDKNPWKKESSLTLNSISSMADNLQSNLRNFRTYAQANVSLTVGQVNSTFISQILAPLTESIKRTTSCGAGNKMSK
jgi:hypothetical protein